MTKIKLNIIPEPYRKVFKKLEDKICCLEKEVNSISGSEITGGQAITLTDDDTTVNLGGTFDETIIISSSGADNFQLDTQGDIALTADNTSTNGNILITAGRILNLSVVDGSNNLTGQLGIGAEQVSIDADQYIQIGGYIGSDATAYTLPVEKGTQGQILALNGQQLEWVDPCCSLSFPSGD